MTFDQSSITNTNTAAYAGSSGTYTGTSSGTYTGTSTTTGSWADSTHSVIWMTRGNVLRGMGLSRQPWGKRIASLVLIAAMMPMSTALEKTGASEAISHGLVAGLGGFGPFALMAGVYFTASLLTMFISNTATAVLLAPIAVQSAVSMGISPYPLLLAVSVGTSMCFASPFSTPPNALVMPAGKYTFMDYVKVGVPLQVIMGLVMVVVIPLFFPFGKA